MLKQDLMELIFKVKFIFSEKVITGGYQLLGVKFIYSEKATKFREIFTLLLNTVQKVKSKVKILQNLLRIYEIYLKNSVQ